MGQAISLRGLPSLTWTAQLCRHVLSRIAAHPVHRLAELLPHNWKPLDAATQA